MLNKNGAEALLEHTGEIILAVIGLGVLIGVVFLIFSPSFGIASEWSCKTSVGLSSGTFGILNKLGIDSIMCYTDDVKSEAKEKQKALNDIAEYMRKCWNMWGEGNLNPEGKNIFYGREEKCFTCYKINFPELKESVSITDINKYLQDTRKYNKLKGENSYWNYFKKSNPANLVNILLPSKSEDKNVNIIEKNKNYAAVYIENIEAAKIKNVLSWAATGAGTGAVLCSFTVVGVPACAIVGGTIGATIDITRLLAQSGWDKITGKTPADGIVFMDYDVAAKNCATVVKAGEEININEAIK